MRKIVIFFVTAALILGSCSNESGYNVSGKLEGAGDGLVILQKREAGEFVRIDSAVIENGSFEISGGAVEYPEMVYLAVDGVRGYLLFFLENRKISVDGHIDSLYQANVEGSVTQSEYEEYNDGLAPYYERNSEIFQELQAAREAEDEEKSDELNKRRDEVYDEIKEYQMAFVKSHNTSYAAPTILRSLTYGMSGDELEKHISELDENLQHYPLIITLKERAEKLKTVAIGKIAPDFTQNDVDGNPVKLSDELGPKLLLLDFWAAWCGPCRAENPNVVAVYEEFNDKGFDVLGVSLDRDKDKWLEAIEADKLSWTQLSDLKYWENEAAQLYAVSAIPANFLLDSEGKILATNVRGEELGKMVGEILNK